MTVSHSVGYSRSVRAKCHAPPPCNGNNIPTGALRYGRAIRSEFGEMIEWRHWGCVTPSILSELAATPEKDISGFKNIKSADQNKIRLAISNKHVDPTDVPPSARVNRPITDTDSPNQVRRPAEQIAPSSSQRPLVQADSSQSQRSSSAIQTTQPLTQAQRTITHAVASGKVKRTVAEAGLDQATHMLRAVLSTTPAPSPEDEDEAPEEEVRDEIYCVLPTSVVGIQYYKGLVGPGEEVLLVREPHNRYDSNAIQVKNISGVQVGHIPRNIASKLAPLLDRRAVTVEGVINDGNLSRRSQYSLSITLKFYGPSDKRVELEPALVWATPGQKGFPKNTSSASTINRNSAVTHVSSSSQRQGSTTAQILAHQETIRKQQEALQKAAELRQMLQNLEKVNDEGRRSSLLDTLLSKDDVLNMPLYENPPGIATGEMTVDLMKHQLQGLRWCIERENPKLPKKETDTPVQFWQIRKRQGTNEPYYFNIATKTPQETPPLLGRGALCADAMGLGKTLTMISLILATRKDEDSGYSKSTLIVAPVSVLSNWEKQIQDHCTPGTVSTFVYYGNTRGIAAAELKKYDIVITTYQTVTGEHVDVGGSRNTSKKKKVERALFEVPWKRVILDEGHTIRNPKTKSAKAVFDLKASRRWVLTGTPIINSPKDLGSILTFLQICRPLDNEDFFKRLVIRPLKNGEASGAELLRALMSHICIRRTKEMQDSNGNSIIELPPVEMIKVPVALSNEARLLYDEVEALSKERLVNAIKGGTSNVLVHSNVLSMLTRMRQIALHPGLVPASYLEQLRTSIGDISEKPIAITPTEKLRLQTLLAQAIEDCEECPICFGVLPNDARITYCAHVFCFACISEILSRDAKCPMDRRALTKADLYEPPLPTDLTQKFSSSMLDEKTEGLNAGSSAKIEQLIHLLTLTPLTEKSLVFSQYTSFLDKIAEALDEKGIPYVRFDGKMTAKRRQEAIARFSVPISERLNASCSVGSRDTKRTRKAKYIISGGASDDNDNGSDLVASDNDDYLVSSDEEIPKKSSKGKGKAKIQSRLSTDSDDLESKANPRVMLLSLKAGALGLNLTVANNVYLMDPWWQEGIESQAVDRVNRIGQKKNVHVYQLVSENTVESKVLEIQEKKKQLIQQAFSGIKSRETQRQQREARLQDLVELFGIRNSQLQ